MSLINAMTKHAIAGVKVPGRVVGEPREVEVSYFSNDPARAGTKVTRTELRAPVITLRGTNPANGPVRQYLTKTDEAVTGPFVFPRYSPVIGLDVTEDGEVIDLDTLIDLTMDSTLAFQSERLARQETTVPLDD